MIGLRLWYRYPRRTIHFEFVVTMNQQWISVPVLISIHAQWRIVVRDIIWWSMFSKIYLSHTYQQVKLDEDSQAYLTINTHKGLFHCKWLPLGVSIVPDIFQRIVDRLLQEVKFTICHLDDILISECSIVENLQILEEALSDSRSMASCWILPSASFLSRDLTSWGWIDKDVVCPLP